MSGIKDIKLHKAPKWHDWDEYVLEYKGRFRHICVSGVFKAVCRNDIELNNEIRFQVNKATKEIDREIELENSASN